MPVEQDSPLCPYCGYCTRGLPSDVCPECGRPCPEPFRSLPASALLPWERRPHSLQIWRFLRTVAYACTHYVRYLRTLRDRRDTPIYQGARLAIWLIVALLVVPTLAHAVEQITFPVASFPLRPRAWLRFWFVSFVKYPLPGLDFALFQGILWSSQALLAGSVIHWVCRLCGRRSTYGLALGSTAPAILGIELACRIAALVFAHANAFEGIGVMAYVEMFPPAVCAPFALRVVWGLRLRIALPTALALGTATYLYAHLLWQAYAKVTLWWLTP